MRDVLPNEGPAKRLAIDLKPAALVGLTLVLPFAALELLHNTVAGRNAPGLLVLFGLLWLLPTAFILILVPLARTARGGRVTENPFSLSLRLALLISIAAVWASILLDQMPCFMGVPNCD
jgi:hypothetical protein